MAAAVDPNRVIYLVERHPPAPTHNSPLLDKIRSVAAPTLAILGLAIFLGAAFALGGHLFGYAAISSDTVQMLFMTSVMSIISGFHLARDTPLAAEIGSGPLSLSMM